ncbi:MAG: SDR family oxidoreductase [Burkholderiales bacterium]|nr:SDR family oxidoreductase [Burkholderiales bacterium]
MTGTCLITGGARGIGRATALAAARDGWDVAINYRERADAAKAVVAEVQALGRRAVAIQADIALEVDILRLFSCVESDLGPLRGLVNSAGIALGSRVAALDAAALGRMMQVNVIGLMLCCREAARRMSTAHGGRGGSVVNISSMAATIGGRSGASTYAASKGAVDVFTSGFAKEVAAEGIRVNVVRPGVTDTDIIAGSHGGPRRAEIEATIPMKRFASPAEVAEAVVWLLSDKASFVTGTHLNAGGGGFLVGAG